MRLGNVNLLSKPCCFSTKRVPFKLVVFVLLGGMFAATSALAQSVPALQADSDIFAKSAKALTVLLVTAILIENALAVIFNWRVFLAYFSLRGVRTLISFGVSLFVVTFFDLDAVSWLLGEYSPSEQTSGWFSKGLSALILAGGSSGVHNIMRSLGYRDPRRVDEVVPKVGKDKAWLAIWIKREQAVGPINVCVSELDEATVTGPAIAGTIGGKRPNLLELLFRNPNRFPQNGGYTVIPGKPYRIVVEGYDEAGQILTHELSDGALRFAPGAIVDFRVGL